jgi:hypothetical protein
VKLVYRNENRLLVGNARNIVQRAGIEVVLKNEYAGGGVGELAPLDTWPELWVVEDSNYDRAQRLLAEALASPQAGPWRCRVCNELNDAAFELCWKCETERP